MFGFKKKITEQAAAEHFVTTAKEIAEESWPKLAIHLTNKKGDSLVVLDDAQAAKELALAMIATDLLSVENIFSKDQSKRIRAHVLIYVEKDFGSESPDVIGKYEKVFKDTLARTIDGKAQPQDIVTVISDNLLIRLLQENINEFRKFLGKITNVTDPLILVYAQVFVNSLKFWKFVIETYRVSEK